MVQADFMKLPFPENSFDAVYAIEATCHAPDAVSQFFFPTLLVSSILSPCFCWLNFFFVLGSMDATRRFTEY